MSAAEVIEQIRALPKAEQALVAKFVLTELPGDVPRTRVMDDKTFEAASEEVFTEYRELLSRPSDR